MERPSWGTERWGGKTEEKKLSGGEMDYEVDCVARRSSKCLGYTTGEGAHNHAQSHLGTHMHTYTHAHTRSLTHILTLMHTHSCIDT